jgi:hypothetical protein
VAEGFADPTSSIPQQKVGAMISAYVHPDDVMTPKELSEWNQKRPAKTVLSKGSHEDEVTVRPGATVHVTGTKTYKANGDSNEKVYKAPKRGKT